MVFFSGQYFQKTEEISKELGFSVSMSSWSDGIFEQGHQMAKIGTLRPSGQLSNIELNTWGESILWQQLSNSYLILQEKEQTAKSVQQRFSKHEKKKSRALENLNEAEAEAEDELQMAPTYEDIDEYQPDNEESEEEELVCSDGEEEFQRGEVEDVDDAGQESEEKGVDQISAPSRRSTRISRICKIVPVSLFFQLCRKNNNNIK